MSKDTSQISPEVMYEKITQEIYSKLILDVPCTTEQFKRTYNFFKEFPTKLRKKMKVAAKKMNQFSLVVVFDNKFMSKYFDLRDIENLCIFDYGYAIFAQINTKIEVVYVRDEAVFAEICKMKDVFIALSSKSYEMTFHHCLSNIIYNDATCNTTCEIVTESNTFVLTMVLQVPDSGLGKKRVDVTVENENRQYTFSFFFYNSLPKFKECVF